MCKLNVGVRDMTRASTNTARANDSTRVALGTAVIGILNCTEAFSERWEGYHVVIDVLDVDVDDFTAVVVVVAVGNVLVAIVVAVDFDVVVFTERQVLCAPSCSVVKKRPDPRPTMEIMMLTPLK